MRKNLPVTQVETRVRADQYLISKTDTRGVITYANPAFVEISGYSAEELLGQPHNVVRHPDMPAAAFQDLWDTLQTGKPWTGLVKNRRKDGGFYWVLANVTPIVEDGELVGYASVRIRPSREQIEEAEALYESMNEGTLSGYTLREGELVPTGWRRMLRGLTAPFSASLRAGMLRMALLSTLITVVTAWFALNGGIPAEQTPLFLAGLAAALLFTFGYGWVIAQRVLKPLRGVTEIARQIAAGNLQVNIESDRADEAGELVFHMDMMRRCLIGIAHDVHASVHVATHTAQKLAVDNQNLAIRNHNQTAALQETAVSMQQLASTVQQNADNARLANQMSDNSMQTARRGGEVVNAVVNSMGRINESSLKIGDIVALIESIAFQTNILALNAAVEAARAGEAGRGFAVVATEVRNLAQKSAGAAKEIKELIEESVTRMQDGAQEAQRAGETMQEIVESVTRVADLINEISVASNQQTGELAEINLALSHLGESTHANVEFGHELGYNIGLLADDAHSLRRAIEVLNIGAHNMQISLHAQPVDMRAEDTHIPRQSRPAALGAEKTGTALPNRPVAMLQ